MRWVVIGSCSYELAALATGKVPTITMLARRHRWLGPVVLTVLAVHLLRQPPVVIRPADIPEAP